jgi:hypothetical protein
MISYWMVALFMLLGVVQIPPEYMYSDHENPMVVAWNWSFFPVDLIFSVSGLYGRFGQHSLHKKQLLETLSLALMFCAGLMAVSFWVVQNSYDVFWWGVNLWLILLSSTVFLSNYGREKNA